MEAVPIVGAGVASLLVDDPDGRLGCVLGGGPGGNRGVQILGWALVVAGGDDLGYLQRWMGR